MVARAVSRSKTFRGLRPTDPGRDMGQIAALIGEAFGRELTRQGREALREMRIMSHLGPLLWLLDRTSVEFYETFQGFVWVEEGRIIGNVNVSRAGPYSRRWLISNVAVRSDYRGRGIAHHLVQAAINLAMDCGGEWILLQVHTDNIPACKLYRDLGFEQITAVTELHLERFQPLALAPAKATQGFVLRRRNYSEWSKEYALALASISKEAQWLHPLRVDQFMAGLDQRLSKWLSNLLAGREEHRLAVEEGDQFIATLTVQASRWRGHHCLEFMIHPDYRGQLEEFLIARALNILKDYPKRGVVVTHPAEHREAIEALKSYGFTEKRTLAQMRLALT